ncbi:MAG TPA: alpha-mannosidase [Thermomicrobiales bacterium]|jgi:alpha-mannosidase
MVDKALPKFAARIAEIEGTVLRHRQPLPSLRLASEGAGGPGQRAATDWKELPVGGAWGGYDQTVWLHGEIVVPAAWAGERVEVLIRLGDYALIAGNLLIAGPEALAYLDGAPFAGVDRWHESLLLTEQATGAEYWTLALEVYSGRITEPHTFRRYELATRDRDADGLAHDLRTAYETLAILDPASGDAALLTRALNAALALVDFRQPRSAAYYASLTPAREAFAATLRDYRHGTRPRVVATGHAHIDVAWHWQIAQTRRKAARTFATVLRLMEEYPEYHFTQSQPQLYQWIKEDEPTLYAQVAARVAEGRWEPTGVMWLEPDTNVPSGESLVRQCIYGMRFFEEEYGQRTTVLWLPDVFGYSWALPQILRGVGVTKFMTSKISWNDTNAFPHDTFRWRGTDGSEVLTHFITTPDPGERYYTYNGHMSATEVLGTPQIYRQKEINDQILYLFGWGDGGGGPTREMLEAGQRFGALPGMPELVQGGAEELLTEVEARVLAPETIARVPIWEGELYFEFHRGTYTSQGRTKYAHRRAEIALHEAELWDAVAHATAATLRGDTLDDAWRTLLLQQFHDILPGSSIAEVYDDTARDLAAVTRAADELRDAAFAAINATNGQAGCSLSIFNATPWTRHDPLHLSDTTMLEQGLDVANLGLSRQELAADGGILLAPPDDGIPPLGYLRQGIDTPGSSAEQPQGTLTISETVLENRFYRLELDQQGLIRSLRDKRVDSAHGGRELIAPGERGNRLIAFEDKPIKYDAWDIDLFYQEKPYPLDALDALTVIERGPLRGGVEIRRRFLDSTITQRLLIYRDIPRIDFVTEIDWHRHQMLLKAAFPVTIHASRATYEIQFGTVERPTHWNTSWDRARFEVCAQRWADLSEGDYGIALLNDGKYGHDIHGNTIRLTLLKSGIHPDPNADLGRHRFTYSLLPHAGDWRTGDVIAHAAALNTPLRAHLAGTDVATASPTRFSLVTCDRSGVIIDTVKPAFDGRGLIVRLYEGHGTRGTATLTFAHPIAWAEECNLLEEQISAVKQVGEQALQIAVMPYALKTLRIGF